MYIARAKALGLIEEVSTCNVALTTKYRVAVDACPGAIATSTIPPATAVAPKPKQQPHELLDPVFEPLVLVLREFRCAGHQRPSRSTVNDKLLASGSCFYAERGISRFKDYSEAARKAGVVKMGGTNGHTWVELQGEYWLPPPPVPQSSERSLPASMWQTKNEAAAERFRTLVEVLQEIHRSGNARPQRTNLGELLPRYDVLVYKKAQTKNFAKYILAAVENGVVMAGGTGSMGWIALRPEWRKKC